MKFIITRIFLLTFLVFGLAVSSLAQNKSKKAAEKFAAASTPMYYGLEDANSRHITEAVYTSLLDLGNGFWLAELNNKQGVINKLGAWVIQPKYQSVEQIHILWFARIIG